MAYFRYTWDKVGLSKRHIKDNKGVIGVVVADDYLVSEKPAVPIFTARDPLILSNKELGCQSERFGIHLLNTRCYTPVDLTFNTHPQKNGSYSRTIRNCRPSVFSKTAQRTEAKIL